MKKILYILFSFPVFGFAQTNTTTTDLNMFTAPLTKQQIHDSYHSQIFIDSLVQVSKGVTVEMTLRKETAKWPNGVIQYIRYYNGLKPFGNWTYFSSSNDTLFTLMNYKNHILLKSFKEANNITRIRKFSSIENLESTTCEEQLVFPNGHILATGYREPIQVIDHTELLETGKWKYFFVNGKLESKGKFKDGKKDGKWVYYNQYGDKIRIVNFNAGELVSQKEIGK